MPFTASPIALPDELVLVCKLLRERLQILGVKADSIKRSEWEQVPGKILDLIPLWLREMHDTFALFGTILETDHPHGDYRLQFRFFSPVDFCDAAQEGHHFPIFLASGYLPIGYEADGNLWLQKMSEGSEGPLYWFQDGFWDRTAQGLPQALTFATSRFALALCAMEVVENDTEPRPGVMWIHMGEQ